MKHDLQKAEAYYRRKKYLRAIRLLEPQVFRYRENFHFYYLLGLSCLRSGDSSGARTYLDRALSIKPTNEPSLLALAVVHLKRYEVSEAIQCYLDVIDEYPKSRKARKGLNLLKRNADRENLTPIIDSHRVDRLLPRDRRSAKPLLILLSVVVIIAAGGLIAVRYLKTQRDPPREPLVASLSLSGVDSMVAPDSEASNELSPEEIERAFDDAKSYFSAFRDNLVIREVNRIVRSNASEVVKERARTIRSYVSTPDFTTIKDPFSYAEVAGDPSLYYGTYVTWSGRVSNLVIGDESLLFDLLVGYESNQVLEGVVPIVYDFGIDLSNGRPVEVLATIIDRDGWFSLQGVSIHKLTEE